MEYFILLPEITYSIAPLLAAGIGMLGSGLLSWLSSSIGQQKSKGLMNHQFKLNKDMFDYTNEYNLPVHQMERLKQAGLNPNLVYGNGSVAGNVGSSSGVSIANASGPAFPTSSDFLNYYQMDLDRKIKEKQAQQLESIARKNDAETIKIANETVSKEFYRQLKAAEKLGLDLDNKWLKETFETRKDDLIWKVNNQIMDNNLAHMKANEEAFRMEHILPLQEKEMISRIALTDAQTAKEIVHKKLDEYDLNHLKPLQKEKLYKEIDNAIIKNDMDGLEVIMKTAIGPQLPGVHWSAQTTRQAAVQNGWNYKRSDISDYYNKRHGRTIYFNY